MAFEVPVQRISAREALAEFRKSQKFVEALSSGLYIFAESHLCLNLPEYIRWNADGKAELTEYACSHKDECCLTFIQSIPDSYLRSKSDNPMYSFMTSVPLLPAPHFFCDEDEQRKHVDKCKKDKDAIKDVLKDLPQTFNAALDDLMKWREVDEEDLASSADLSSKTVRRLRTKEDYNTTTETVVQLCIGLQLPPMLSDHLLKAAGRHLRDVEPDISYKFLLYTYYNYSLDVCNEFLESCNIPKLGRKKKE